MAHTAIESLRERLGQVYDLRAAIALMHWDQEVYMPPKGASARGRQLATVSALAHRLFTDDALGDLLDAAESADLSGDDAALVSETRYDYERARKVPEEWVERFAVAQSMAYEAWVRARKDSDFAQFAPHLETLLKLSRERADFLGYEGSPYNALLDEYERGMTAAQLRVIFGELAEKQRDLLARIVKSPKQPNTEWLESTWYKKSQLAFTEHVLRDMGYDMEAGRQDLSVHPFSTSFDKYDVRVTTRIDREDVFSGLTGSIHEGGHALYEQGFRDEDRRTPLAESPSLGMHESQSRMWENMVGRSRPFWKHYKKVMRRYFPSQLAGVRTKHIYRAINRVAPTLIRVEADECTYNLHVILRFEIEIGLIEGTIAVADVPALWNEKVASYLGLKVPDDAQGCLQDIHWSHGSFGYFPTYALGNLYAAQLMEVIERDLPTLWDEIAAGNMAPLLTWLRENIHHLGRRKTAAQIVEAISGRAPDAKAYLAYLEKKYSDLYDL